MNLSDINFHTHDPNSDVVCLSTREYRDFPVNPGQRLTVGLHPWDTGTNNIDDFEILAEAIADPRVIAIGEIGLDPLRGAPVDRQMHLLRLQIKHAQNAGLPVVFHIVRSYDRLEALYRELKPTTLWAIHGYRGKPYITLRLAGHGIYMSLGVHFNPISAVLIPDRLLLIETDENDEETISDVLHAVAKVRKVSPTALAAIVRTNMARFYGAL